MTTPFTQCMASGCTPRRVRRARARVAARLATVALVALLTLLMVYGELWLLKRSPATPNEMTLANRLLDSVRHDQGLMNACMQTGATVDKEIL